MAWLTGRVRPEAGPAGVGGRSIQLSPLLRRRRLALIALAIGTYALALVWMLPAAIVIGGQPGIAGVEGSAWRGAALLADGSRLQWRWAPLRSLVGFGFAADWTIDGPGTMLKGQMLSGRAARTFDDVSGMASGGLIAALAPDLPFVCDVPLAISIPHAVIGGDAQALTGEIRGGAGACAPRGGAGGGTVTAVAPLVAGFTRVGQGTEIRVAPLPMRRRTLVDGVLQRDGRLLLRVTRDGGAALPFLSPPTGMSIETTL